MPRVSQTNKVEKARVKAEKAAEKEKKVEQKRQQDAEKAAEKARVKAQKAEKKTETERVKAEKAAEKEKKAEQKRQQDAEKAESKIIKITEKILFNVWSRGLKSTDQHIWQDEKINAPGHQSPRLNINKKQTKRDKSEPDEDTRRENGRDNIRREYIVCQLMNGWPGFPDDPDWEHIRQECIQSLHKLSPLESFDSAQVSQTGGRNHNYDLEIQYSSPSQSSTVHVEFKHCNHKPAIVDLPEILQKSCETTDIFSDIETYTVFYYRNYIHQYIALDDQLSMAECPTLDEYRKQTMTNEVKHPFIQKIKEREKVHAVAKKRVVNESISKYIQYCQEHISLDAVSKLIQSTQTNKKYLLWHSPTRQFHVDTLPEEEMRISELSSVNHNTLIFRANNLYYHFLLRWKNGKGRTNTAWQISVRGRRITIRK